MTGGFICVFNAIARTLSEIIDPKDMLARLKAAADKTLTEAAIGIDAPGLGELVGRLSEYDDPDGLPDADLEELAIGCGAPEVALPGLRAIGLLEQVQQSGEPRWRLLEAARAIVGPQGFL